jgi:cyclic dehypoxanthinyl futalosine synthase
MRDALDFYTHAPLLELGAAADGVRRDKHPNDVVTFIVDRNINYTNVCVADCGFCAFYRRPKHPEGYTLSFEQIGQKIDETKAMGGVQILIQGGHNPYIKFEWYLSLMRYIKEHHPIHIHGFSPSEIDFFAKLYRMDARTVIRELQAAGLDSIPGGGGEILVQRVRDLVAKKKAGADRWLEIMEIAHQERMKTTVTMMYGIGETLAERIEHLERVREVQARTGGFTAFICWPLQPENTPTMSHQPKTDAVEYLRTVAISRIVLDNVPNLQSSWVTMGLKVGQIALRFGCNDFGSLMIEENVVSAANTTHRTSIGELDRLIRDAGALASGTTPTGSPPEDLWFSGACGSRATSISQGIPTEMPSHTRSRTPYLVPLEPATSARCIRIRIRRIAVATRSRCCARRSIASGHSGWLHAR